MENNKSTISIRIKSYYVEITPKFSNLYEYICTILLALFLILPFNSYIKSPSRIINENFKYIDKNIDFLEKNIKFNNINEVLSKNTEINNRISEIDYNNKTECITFALIDIIISTFFFALLQDSKKDKKEILVELESQIDDLCKSIKRVEIEILSDDKNEKFRFKNFKTASTFEKLDFSNNQRTKIKKDFNINIYRDVINKLTMIENLTQIDKKFIFLNTYLSNTLGFLSIIISIMILFIGDIFKHSYESFGKFIITILFSFFIFLIVLMHLYVLSLSNIYSLKIYDNLSYSDYSILIPTYIDILRNNLISIQDNNKDIIKTNQKNIKGKHLFSEEKIETVLTKTRTKTKTRNIKKR